MKEILLLEVKFNVLDNRVGYSIASEDETTLISGHIDTEDRLLDLGDVDNLLLGVHSSIRRIIHERISE